jgi:polyhydroxyalkanoate synthase
MQTNNGATAAEANATVDLEREFRASLAAVTGGIAPDDYVNAWWDWYLHLASEPQQQASITKSAADSAIDMWNFAIRAASGLSLEPAPADKRFSGAAWNQWPYNVYAHAYSSWSDWWQQAISSVPSVAPKNAQLMEFMGKQIMEAASPANHLSTNPELLELTRAESGANLVRGFQTGSKMRSTRSRVMAPNRNRRNSSSAAIWGSPPAKWSCATT